jgi:hypothetical protein
MPLRKAIELIRRIHEEFCFANEQSRINAIARLLTPFARAILGWTTRVPFWFFGSNRPRAGKDYLAAVTLIVFEGYAFEDQTIGRNSEETAKRIIAAARNGRRFFHPSNLQGHLQDPVLA